jgi:polyhydroxybutyrate depolymerase
MLHGAGGNSLLAAKQTNWCEKAEAEKFIVAFPNGLPFNRSRPASFLRNPAFWNSGGTRPPSSINDVLFLDQLLDELAQKYAIDPKKLFAAGFSNGGAMCWRLAIELSEKISAIAPVCSFISLPQPWHQTKAVSAIVISCLDDPLVPIDGGVVKDIWSRVETYRPSVREAVEDYSRLLKSTPPPLAHNLSSDVLMLSYRPGKDNSRLVFYTIADAGHSYPGGHPALSQRIAGKATNAIDATSLIWQFFLESEN